MNRSHHNTTDEPEDNVVQLEAKAKSQEVRVLRFFERNVSLSGWTPSEVNRGCMRDSPITSTRRAITNLTSVGALVRTDEKRKGIYGRPEYVWKLSGNRQPDLFGGEE